MIISTQDLDSICYYKGFIPDSINETVEIDTAIHIVKFRQSLKTTGSIVSPRYTMIQCDGYIKANGNIDVGGVKSINGSVIAEGNIHARSDISASLNIESTNGGIVSGCSIRCGNNIWSKDVISAVREIVADKTICVNAGGISAAYVLSSHTFNVNAQWLKTTILPFHRNYWASQLPLQCYAKQILDCTYCWDSLRELIQPKAKQICAWPGWHPLLRAQLEMFFGLKEKVPFTPDAIISAERARKAWATRRRKSTASSRR
jgi:hypothetical protein